MFVFHRGFHHIGQNLVSNCKLDLLLSQTEKKKKWVLKHNSLNPVRNNDSGNKVKANQDIVHSTVIHNFEISVSLLFPFYLPSPYFPPLLEMFSPTIVKFGMDMVRSQGSQIRKSETKQEEEDIHVIGSGSDANQIQDVKPDAGCQNLMQDVKIWSWKEGIHVRGSSRRGQRTKKPA